MLAEGWGDKPGVKIVFGRWEDVINDVGLVQRHNLPTTSLPCWRSVLALFLSVHALSLSLSLSRARSLSIKPPRKVLGGPFVLLFIFFSCGRALTIDDCCDTLEGLLMAFSSIRLTTTLSASTAIYHGF